ncbi:fabZ, partial [Symbiodinium necroappetens]
IDAMHFDFVDRVLEVSDERIVTVKAVSMSEEYLQDHFPSFPVLPGVFMIESMVQAARRLLTERDPALSRHVLSGVRALKYGTFVSPGRTMRIEVSLLKETEEGFEFKGSGVVLEAVQEVLVDALGVDDDEVTPEARLTADLGAESIDFLDISFKLEQAFAFKIPQGEMFPENVAQDPNYVQDGKITETGLVELQKKLPHFDFSEFGKDPQLTEIGNVFTVDSLVNYVERKLETATRMRWMWIDRITELETGVRLVAIKNVSLAEEHLHDHFAADPERGLGALPVMPSSLIIEGMAQSAGILVGHANGFKEKVVLAKVSKAEINRDATAGMTIRYTAEIERMDEGGASTKGTVEFLDPATGASETVGAIDLMFSHIDNNRSGLAFPEHNFVFGESFRTLLEMSGVEGY